MWTKDWTGPEIINESGSFFENFSSDIKDQRLDWTSGPEPPGGRLGHIDMRTKDWTGPETANESAKYPEKFIRY